MPELGLMQGRLSPLYEEQIQAFPWDHWRAEFSAAAELGLYHIEWTLDRERLHQNPIMTEAGRVEIARLSAVSGVVVRTLTADCFMQMPFHREHGSVRKALLTDAIQVLEGCRAATVEYVVLPIVDDGAISNDREMNAFVLGVNELLEETASSGVSLLLESEEEPAWIAALLKRLPADRIGINYDIGNSAACGHDPVAEFAAYGQSIENVHIKDRISGGRTVPLGEGAANFDLVFRQLEKIDYQGRYILQTARATDDDHAGVLRRYRDFVLSNLRQSDGSKPRERQVAI